MKKHPLLLGAHTSTAGGLYHALLEGEAIGATTVQLFTRNQRQWAAKPLEDEEIRLFQDTLQSTALSHIMSHASYLINLGSPRIETLHKSRKAFREEIIRCQQLGLTFLNFHPGAALDSTKERCLETIKESLHEIIPLVEQGSTRLLIETTAGQGSVVGDCFEDLAFLLKDLHKQMPLGICIDTCHLFAAGYDLRTKEALHNTLMTFDRIIGLDHLYALHINDSMKPFNSKLDRHAPLGQGEIGIDCFRELMRHPATKNLPKYLETPEGPPLWKKEIALLKTFAP